nr:retrovirus-related Pol polyprotein from transposon TNT 1-94 [Tanacetum cinerariifolium]
MLADSKLSTTFWAEAVNTACYVQNRVLVVKPHFKTPYELFKGRSPAVSFMRPFGCHVTILNTLDQLGKFDGKSDEGIFVGHSIISKALKSGGPEWLFDIDALLESMNYAPVPAGTNSNDFVGKRASFVACQSSLETGSSQDYILMPLWKDTIFDSSSQDSDGHNKDKHGLSQKSKYDTQKRPNAESSTKTINTVGPVKTAIPTYADYPKADYNNLETKISVSPIPFTRVHKDHLKNKSLMEPKKTLVDLPHGKRAIGTKWVFRNKRDQKGIVVRNKARLIAQGHRQEEGMDYDEFFAPVTRIEAIRLFMAYASFMDFTVYQMDVKSAFLYGTIEEEVYFSQPPGFVDLEFPDRVYKVEKALYGLHQAPKAWYETLSTYLLENGFRRGTINKTLFIKQIKNDILLVQVYVDDIIFGSIKKSLSTEFEQLMHKQFQISSMGELTFFLGLQVEQRTYGIFLIQNKYVCDILKKFGFSSVNSASTPMETHKPLLKDATGTDVHVHLYRYLKGQPTLGSDYAGSSLDRKSTTKGLELKGCLINDGCADLVKLLVTLLILLVFLMLVFTNITNGHQFTMSNNKKELAILEQTTTGKEFSNPNSDSKKFLMYPWFLQLFLNNQLKDLPETFNDTYATPCHTKKVFSNMTRKSVNFSRKVTPLFDSMLVQNQAPEGEGSAIPPEPQTVTPQIAAPSIIFHEAHIQPILQSLTTYQRKRAQKRRRTQKDTELPQTSVPLNLGADEAIHKKEGMNTCGSPRCQETMGGTPAQTRSERVLQQPNEPPVSEGLTCGSGEGRMEQPFELMDTIPPTPHDSPLIGGYTPGSDEGRLKLLELMNTYTTLSNRVTTLENELSSTKVVYHKAFITLTKRVKKLEIQLKQNRSRAVIHSSDKEEPSLDAENSPK